MDLRLRLQPESRKPCRRILAQHAETHDPDAHIFRPRLLQRPPDMAALLQRIASLLAQVMQALQHDPFAHAVCEVVADIANHRDGGQRHP